MTGAELVTAVLALWPVMSGDNRACIEARRDRIAEQVEESVRVYPTIRPALLVAIAFSETHLGCDRDEGGNWGAPISPTRRHVAGTHLHAARILSRSLEVCHGDELSAARRFRTGLCHPLRQSSSAVVGRVGEAYGRRVLRMAARIEAQVRGDR